MPTAYDGDVPRDPLILNLTQAASLCGIDRHTFARWLEDPAFREAVIIDVPDQRVRISRPKLETWLHGRETTASAEVATRTWTVRSPSFALLPQVERSTTRRQDDRVKDFLESTAEFGDTTVEEVLERLTTFEDNTGTSLLEQTIHAASRESDRRKIRSLARVAANVVSGDDAAIKMSSLVLPEILLLQSHHVPVLVDVSKRGPGQMRVIVGAVRTGPPQGEEAVIEAVLAQLNARGLVSNQAGATTIGAPQASYYITGLGSSVLQFLVDYPEHPNHVQT